MGKKKDVSDDWEELTIHCGHFTLGLETDEKRFPGKACKKDAKWKCHKAKAAYKLTVYRCGEHKKIFARHLTELGTIKQWKFTKLV